MEYQDFRLLSEASLPPIVLKSCHLNFYFSDAGQPLVLCAFFNMKKGDSDAGIEVVYESVGRRLSPPFIGLRSIMAIIG